MISRYAVNTAKAPMKTYNIHKARVMPSIVFDPELPPVRSKAPAKTKITDTMAIHTMHIRAARDSHIDQCAA